MSVSRRLNEMNGINQSEELNTLFRRMDDDDLLPSD